MDKSLCIDEKEFMTMPTKRQMCVLFQNQVRTIELIDGYKFWQKITATIGSGMFIVVGWLLQLHLKGG